MNREPHIAVSSLALAGGKDAKSRPTPEEIIAIARSENYILEFSSGMPYRKDMETLFLEAPLKKIPHNYFPAPEIPFVLNLASANDEIRNRSVAHCINGLRLASLAGAPFFSAHAGFCIDPDPAELGKQLKRSGALDKQTSWTLFMGSVKQILKETEKYKVDFLIENNVIAGMNLYPDGANPLFCCDAGEMTRLILETAHPRLGILLDTGHLKVSSLTLNFSLPECLSSIKSWVKCIHHSDNDGIFDTNQPVTGQYWFLPFLKEFGNVYHVLEVKNQTVEQVNDQLRLIRKTIQN